MYIINMREILTDELVRAECSIFQPFPESQLLNDVSSIQAERFKPGSKMNMFLKTVSGSRPESIVAQAISMSGVTNTAVAEDLAMRLRYLHDRDLDPVNLENIQQQLAAEAQQQQADAQMRLTQLLNTGLDFDEATDEVESSLVQTEMSDAISAEELSEMEDHASMVSAESSQATTSGMELGKAFSTYTRQELLTYYARVKQTGSLPASFYKTRGTSRAEIMEAIIGQQPNIQASDLVNHKNLYKNAAALKDELSHNHPRRGGRRERAGSDSEIESSPMKLGGTIDIASDLDESSDESFKTAESTIETEQRQNRGTVASRFEERHHIPEWMNAFSHAAQDLLQGNRGGEGMARRGLPQPRDEGDL